MKYFINTFLQELFIFIKKQAWASIFGALLLLIIIVTKWVNFNHFFLTRYDVIFLMAILIQVVLLVTKMETLRELKVIFSFHLLAVVMELFKTSPSIASWKYPDKPGLFMFYTVPLFTGFLYSAVGSYIARAWKIFNLYFVNFPKLHYLGIFSFVIYLNFFTHHYVWDMRWLLFLTAIILFRKTRVYFTMVKTPRSMPLLMGLLFISFFLYIAENIGTYMKVWLYPNQTGGWHLVGFNKFGSWFLLIIISFTLVAFIYKDQIYKKPIKKSPRR